MERKIDGRQYQYVIVYGIGQYYEIIKTELFHQVHPDYLCDRKWDLDAPKSYDGIPVIKRENLYRLRNSLVIIAAGASWSSASIKRDLEHILGLTIVYVDEIIGRSVNITGEMLKRMGKNGYYQDSWGNIVQFDLTIPDKISIFFYGKNNQLFVGNRVSVGELTVGFGNEGICKIGDRAEIMGAYFAVSGAKVLIGKDSLFSTQVLVRNHDGHHIFDLETQKRINYSRDIIIEDHVWIGYRALLLAGTRIGTGTVVGAGTVTSGQFGEHQVIAGCPARVIREHICWSKDNTDYFNHEYLEACVSQDARKYL